jgi:hypothetical protein
MCFFKNRFCSNFLLISLQIQNWQVQYRAECKSEPSKAPCNPETENRKSPVMGTRWSIAKQIPNNVKPIGGGDFAGGFYTHYDADNAKAERRGVSWGMRMANKRPSERFAGVVRFDVWWTDYLKLFTGGKGRVFDLKRTDQSTWKNKRNDWILLLHLAERKILPLMLTKMSGFIHFIRD